MDNKSKKRYDQSPEKIELHKKVVSFIYIFNYKFIIV